MFYSTERKSLLKLPPSGHTRYGLWFWHFCFGLIFGWAGVVWWVRCWATYQKVLGSNHSTTKLSLLKPWVRPLTEVASWCDSKACKMCEIFTTPPSSALECNTLFRFPEMLNVLPLLVRPIWKLYTNEFNLLASTGSSDGLFPVLTFRF